MVPQPINTTTTRTIKDDPNRPFVCRPIPLGAACYLLVTNLFHENGQMFTKPLLFSCGFNHHHATTPPTHGPPLVVWRSDLAFIEHEPRFSSASDYERQPTTLAV
jgi:hypothetical protein